MLGGKFAGGTGSVLAVTPAMVSITVVCPSAGLSKMKFVVVTTSAKPSLPKATPSGGSLNAKVWVALLSFRLITESAFEGVEGAV